MSIVAIDRPKSLTETVLKRLRDAIVSGDLPLGAALSERQLAEQLNVSKTPVRESLVQLRTEGLVTIVPQKGVYVFTLSAQEVNEICEFRLTLEGSALGLAIKRNRAGLAQQMTQVVDEMTDAQKRSDTRRYLALDTDFHAAIFEHCGNGYMLDSYSRYVGKIAALRTHLASKPMHTKLSFEEHIRIRDAVRDDTLKGASEILRKHIGRTQRTYSLEVEDIAAADQGAAAGARRA
jgi:DNA-binding GntR family transcriptional regulator